MRCLIGKRLMAVWAGKPLRMKRPLQVLIAFLLTEKLIDGKPDHGNTWRPTFLEHVVLAFTKTRGQDCLAPG